MEELAWVWVKEQFALLQHGLRLLLIFWADAIPALLKFSLEKSQALNHLALILAGIIGIPLLWIRTRAADRQARAANEHARAANEQARVANEQSKTANEQARVANKQARTAEQGHITGRFTSAIEQLGSEKMAVRLGAIYALERLSKDSPEDHWTIMEVLTAYVRDNASWPPKQTIGNPFVELQGGDGDGAVAADEKLKKGAGQEGVIRPSTDIQAILTVLGRRESWATMQHTLFIRKLDLQGTDLRGADLFDGHLGRTDLRGAHLEGADLRRAHVDGSALGGAHLEGADLSRAHLEAADLTRAHLEGATLEGAHLEGANLSKAHLQYAKLHQAQLQGAKLDQAHLQDAMLPQAHLEGAELLLANLKEAFLLGAHLEGAKLCGANLEGARLWNAHLEGADLREALLTQPQLNSAFGDEHTILPEGEGLTRPARWLNPDPSPAAPPTSPPPSPEAPGDTPIRTSR